MTTLYRIHVEAVDLTRIASMAAEHFDAFTLSESTGYWRGIAERSATVEVYGTPADAQSIGDLAERLRAAFAQETVLIATVPIGKWITWKRLHPAGRKRHARRQAGIYRKAA